MCQLWQNWIFVCFKDDATIADNNRNGLTIFATKEALKWDKVKFMVPHFARKRNSQTLKMHG